jgi:hypothetical protein
LEPLQIIFQILLAVVIAAVGFIVRRLSSDIKDFTENLKDVAKKITELEVEMIRQFVLKEELVPIKNRIAELLSREDMSLLRQQVNKLTENVTALMARAELLRRSGEK